MWWTPDTEGANDWNDWTKEREREWIETFIRGGRGESLPGFPPFVRRLPSAPSATVNEAGARE